MNNGVLLIAQDDILYTVNGRNMQFSSAQVGGGESSGQPGKGEYGDYADY